MYVLNPFFFTLNIPQSFRRSIDSDQYLASTASRALQTLQGVIFFENKQKNYT